MVFLEPVELEISTGQVVGQRWVDRGIEKHLRWDRYGAHVRGRITADAIPMYPFCATIGDMRRIVRRFREISQTIRDENPDCWEADMYGLVIAMHEAGLRVETRDDLGVCNNWEQRTGPLPKLIHYPARVLDEDGQVLWSKQSYTPATRRFPWSRPPAPERAGNPLERRLLEVLHEHVDRQEAELRRVPA